MKYLPLVWRNLTRRKTRTIFTILSIAVAFVLFGVLAALNVAFSQGVELAGNDRLIIQHKVSLIQLLPESYQARLETTPGVVDVLHQTWFGGIYQKPSNFFMQCPVVPARLLKLYPEYVLPADQRKAFLSDRTCAIVGRQTANRFGFKVGDRVPIQATIWRKKGGGLTTSVPRILAWFHKAAAALKFRVGLPSEAFWMSVPCAVGVPPGTLILDSTVDRLLALATPHDR